MSEETKKIRRNRQKFIEKVKGCSYEAFSKLEKQIKSIILPVSPVYNYIDIKFGNKTSGDRIRSMFAESFENFVGYDDIDELDDFCQNRIKTLFSRVAVDLVYLIFYGDKDLQYVNSDPMTKLLQSSDGIFKQLGLKDANKADELSKYDFKNIIEEELPSEKNKVVILDQAAFDYLDKSNYFQYNTRNQPFIHNTPVVTLTDMIHPLDSQKLYNSQQKNYHFLLITELNNFYLKINYKKEDIGKDVKHTHFHVCYTTDMEGTKLLEFFLFRFSPWIDIGIKDQDSVVKALSAEMS